jgi:hypothetical protein
MKGKQEKERKEFRTWLFIETFECNNKRMKSELRALQAEGTQKSKIYPYITVGVYVLVCELPVLEFVIVLTFLQGRFCFPQEEQLDVSWFRPC